MSELIRERKSFRRLLALGAAAGMTLSLATGFGAGTAYAGDERRPPVEQTREGDVCDWYTCWMYHLDCFANGGTSESLVDDDGNYAVVCHEKEDTTP